MRLESVFRLELCLSLTPDSLNNTRFEVEGIGVWPSDGTTVPMPELGDRVWLTIPSGTLEGIVSGISYDKYANPVLVVFGSWTGKYNGLRTGKCALGRFTAEGRSGAVETSVSPDLKCFADYLTVREMVYGEDQYSGRELPRSPVLMRNLYRVAWSALKGLRKEIATACEQEELGYEMAQDQRERRRSQREQEYIRALEEFDAADGYNTDGSRRGD